jgi:hypothetical protein
MNNPSHGHAGIMYFMCNCSWDLCDHKPFLRRSIFKQKKTCSCTYLVVTTLLYFWSFRSILYYILLFGVAALMYFSCMCNACQVSNIPPHPFCSKRSSLAWCQSLVLSIAAKFAMWAVATGPKRNSSNPYQVNPKQSTLEQYKNKQHLHIRTNLNTYSRHHIPSHLHLNHPHQQYLNSLNHTHNPPYTTHTHIVIYITPFTIHHSHPPYPFTFAIPHITSPISHPSTTITHWYTLHQPTLHNPHHSTHHTHSLTYVSLASSITITFR